MGRLVYWFIRVAVHVKVPTEMIIPEEKVAVL